MPAILRLQEAATSHLYLRERVGNPIGRERIGTVLATRSALTGSNRPLPRARTAAKEIIVGRAAAPATSGRLRRQLRKAPDQPVVVRKILKLLEREGLVALRQGRHGGGGLRHRIWHYTRSDLQGG